LIRNSLNTVNKEYYNQDWRNDVYRRKAMSKKAMKEFVLHQRYEHTDRGERE